MGNLVLKSVTLTSKSQRVTEKRKYSLYCRINENNENNENKRAREQERNVLMRTMRTREKQ